MSSVVDVSAVVGVSTVEVVVGVVSVVVVDSVVVVVVVDVVVVWEVIIDSYICDSRGYFPCPDNSLKSSVSIDQIIPPSIPCSRHHSL